jgi:hypothetical protein
MNLLESFSGVELNMLLWWSWFAFILSQLCFLQLKAMLLLYVFCDSYENAYSSAVSVVACKILVSNCSKVLIPIAIIPYLAIFI